VEFDPEIIEQGLRMTIIGLATAFALLFVLAVFIVALGRFAGPKVEDGAGDASGDDNDSAGPVRERAMAAVVAVSALRARAPR
jgi:Na+-transporting methylmalonyl-CoA/oxaloacetate decarboxylase gamma subunit